MDTITSLTRQTETQSPLRPDHVYTETQYGEGYPPGIEHHYWNRARNLILASQLQDLGIGQKHRILEIGCGTGVVVEHLICSGFDCLGIDAARAPVIETVKDRVWAQAKWEDLSFSIRSQISVLLLLDVIEHWANPTEILRQLRRAFPSLTHMVIYVPARKELWSDHDEHFGHFRRYDLESLSAEILAAGFQVKKAGYLFRGLYWAARILLARSGRRGKRIFAPRSAMAIRMHKMFSRLLWLEWCILPKSWRGSSAFAVSVPAQNN